MRPIVLALVLALSCPIAVADVLWYGGDFDAKNGLYSNYGNGASAYDDFEIGPNGAVITGLFCNLLSLGGPAPFETAAFEIREEMAPGVGGSPLASGISSADLEPTQYGQSVIYRVSIDALSIEIGPGHYWMALAPVASFGAHYILTTGGVNGIGSPISNGNSFYNFPSQGFNFAPTEEALGAGTWDFSYGVVGTEVPEPSGRLILLAFASLLRSRFQWPLFRKLTQ